MKNIFILPLLVHFLYIPAFSQPNHFDLLSNYFTKEIKLPIDSINTLPVMDTLDKALLNRVLFDEQTEKAKFYSLDNKLYRVTTYGRVPEEPFKYETWKKESGKTIWYKAKHVTKVYPLGYITYEEYIGLIVKVAGFESTYCDLYVFNKEGKLKSFVSLYEAIHSKYGHPEEGIKDIINSSIETNGNILWKEDRYNINSSRIFELQLDGHFKVVDQKVEGEFEY
jgi:hypothetical protein